MVVDAARARQVLGWAPGVPLAQGLARTFEWMRSVNHAEPAGAGPR
jgi:nucleoside-diphosphate-sugar epimerase